MIPFSATNVESINWQKELTESFTDLEELLHFLQLEELEIWKKPLLFKNFPLRVTRHFASLMEKGNPDDPLLRQVLPSQEELRSDQRCSEDPLQDLAFYQGNGILHKYKGRILLMTTGACAIHCRYCFRRHFPYQDHMAISGYWLAIAKQLRESTEITEVILSGGDPLMLPNRRLKELIQLLESSPHLLRLRIHTRMPVVLPSRIDQELLSLLQRTKLQTVMVIHCNNAREISQPMTEAMAELNESGITLLNQAVLLKGVNDSYRTQAVLCQSLFKNGVLPYYLHQMDKVAGAAHFIVDDTEAVNIHSKMMDELPGYLVPRLVREIPGKKSKTPLY